MAKGKPSGRQLRLHVFDVGHGDSLLLEFPGGRAFAVIDCHRQTPKGPPKVLQYLLDRNAAGVPVVVKFAALTHPDIDHVRGYADVLAGLNRAGISVEQFWDCPITLNWVNALRNYVSGPSGVSGHLEMVRLMEEVCRLTNDFANTNVYREVRSRPPAEAWVFHSRPKVYIEFLAPNLQLVRANQARLTQMTAAERMRVGRLLGSGTDVNLISSAFRVRYGKSTLLLAGDMMNAAWNVMFTEERVHDPQATVLKVPHHGSRHSNFPDCGPLCDRVRQGLGERLTAVISGGYRQDLPHNDTVMALTSCAGQYYMTGGGVGEVTRPLVPNHSSAEVRSMVAGDDFAREILHEAQKDGHGDIVISCGPDGDCTVETERP